ncbi:MAG: hypothetical protein QOG04_1655 [Actinomycetota bacterium]|nr:hypothetical protein [Actinomycetota bacterium]
MTDKKAEIALLVGGLLAIVGTFMTFATISGGGSSFSLSGKEADEASNYIVAGGFAILTGLVVWFSSGATVRKVMSILAIIIVGFFGVYGAINDISSIKDVAAGQAGGFEVSTGMGLYICLIGSIVAVVGAVMAMRQGGAVVTEPVAPPPA